MNYEAKQSPEKVDEVGMYRERGSKDDQNKAWQSTVKTDKKATTVPAEGNINSGPAGPFPDHKKVNRGLKETILDKPLMTGAFTAGGLGILYMIAKSMRK